MAGKKSAEKKTHPQSSGSLSRRALLLGGAAMGMAGAGVGYWWATRGNQAAPPVFNGKAPVGPDAPYSYSGTHAARNFLTAHGIATLDALAQTVIPSTDTPGAKEINAIAYIETKLDEELAAANAQGRGPETTTLEMLQLGLQWLDSVIGEHFNARFIDLEQAERDEFFEIVVDSSDRQKQQRFDPDGLLKTLIHEVALRTFDAYYSHPLGMRAVGYTRLPIQGYPDYMKKPT